MIFYHIKIENSRCIGQIVENNSCFGKDFFNIFFRALRAAGNPFRAGKFIEKSGKFRK